MWPHAVHLYLHILFSEIIFPEQDKNLMFNASAIFCIAKSSVIIVHPNGESEKASLKIFTNNKSNLYAGSVIYVPRDLKQIDGIELGSVMAPIISSLAISLASLNSISNN